jgi:hypothetical protein
MSVALAYNQNGEPFEVPESAVAWKVRHSPKGRRGAPEVMYGRDGTPLLISIDANIDALRKKVSEPGRYRLDPVDEDHRLIADATPAFIEVAPELVPPLSPGEGSHHSSTRTLESLLVEITHANIESTRTTSALGKSIVDGLSGIMHSVAGMVSNRGDARALPASLFMADIAPREDEEEEEEESDSEGVGAGAGIDLNAMVGQVVTSVVTAVMSGQVKIPTLGALLDWRRAGAPVREESPPAERSTVERASRADTPPSPVAPTSQSATRPSKEGEPAKTTAGAPALALAALSPLELGQLMAVQQALSADERTLAFAVIQELPAAELQVWAKELSRLPLDAAVTKVRETLLGKAAAGGAL